MTVEVRIHFDRADSGEPVWWADSPAVPGLTVAAASLQELQYVAREAVREAGVADANLRFNLVGQDPDTASEVASIQSDLSQPTGIGPRVERHVLAANP